MSASTLLLVDDNPRTQNQVRAMFAGQPITVEVVDGQQALAKIEADRPNLVLASVKKSGIDGYAIAHYVSHNPQLQSVSVLLLLTPRAVDEARIKESGAIGYLTKPLRSGAVVPRVREVLGLVPDGDPNATAPTVTEANGEIDAAFDVIDADMKPGHDRAEEHAISPAVMAQIVADAVTQAILAYERARGLTPASGPMHGTGDLTQPPPAHASGSPHTPPHSAEELYRLQHEMGLDDLAFAETPPPPQVESGLGRALSAEMGVVDFAFEDVPATAPDLATPRPPQSDLAAPRAEEGPDSRGDDDAVNWLADQLSNVREPGRGEEQPAPGAQIPAGEPVHHAVKVVRAGMAHLSKFVHRHKANQHASDELSPVRPQEPKPSIDAAIEPAPPVAVGPLQDPIKE